MNISKYNAIIFDVDGTLWDSCESVCNSWRACLKEKYGRTKLPSLGDIRGIMGYTIEQVSDALLPDFGDNRAEVTRECMSWEVKHLYEEPGILYPGVYDTLKTLSEKTELCIVSNCPDGYIQALLSTHELSPFISDFECIGRTGLSKAENIRLVMERRGYSTAAYVGDMDSDRKAAREAGIAFFHALWGFGSEMPGEVELASISRLLEL